MEIGPNLALAVLGAVAIVAVFVVILVTEVTDRDGGE